MGKVIVLASQKGGVGKTTSTINLAAGLAEYNKKVLVVDMDPQGNATTGLGIDRADIDLCMYNVLVDETEVSEAVIERSEGLDVLPSTMHLAGAEVRLVDMFRREYRLKEKLKKAKRKYDYILIDCPPSLGLITLNALVSADSTIIPVQCEYYALEGLTQLLNTVRIVQQQLNKKLKIEGVLLTMLDARTNLGLEVVKEVKTYFKEKVYATVIPRNVQLAESPSHGLPITEYASQSKGAQVYRNLAKEVIG